MVRYHLKLDCDHKLADDESVTSAQICAKFKLQDIDQGLHVHEECLEAPDSCPNFHIDIQESDTFVEVSVYSKGNDLLLVDSWQLAIEDEVIQTLWADSEGARCISDQCVNGCWFNVLGAELPFLGVTLNANEDWSNMLYEDGHCCTVDYQCGSGICLDGICRLVSILHSLMFCSFNYSHFISSLNN